MRFPERFLEEVKGRFRLSEVIGRSVALKRSGHEVVGLSPFNKEKTPSFYVNDDKGQFFDFSSGKNGDIYDWLQLHDGLSFIEAVKRLADEAGVEVPAQDERAHQADRRRRDLEGLLEQAQAFFQSRLMRSDEARAYLERRGLTGADIERFGIGYAPDYRTALRDTLSARPEDLLEAGVLAATDDGQLFDRYRHRITFPIHDAGGKLVSFGARALDPKAKAKYLNGPDTALFDKGRQLYGLHAAKRLLLEGPGPLLVVEGYMDVIACLRAGIASCAPMGTALTQMQIDLMWRFHPEPTLCFDADPAGRRAAAKAMDNTLPKLAPGRSVRFYHVIGGKDPDDVLRTQGPDALRVQITKATPFVEAIFQREVGVEPTLDTPEKRAGLRMRLRKIVEAVSDATLRQEYGVAIRDRLDALYRAPAAKRSAAPGAMESAKALRETPPPVRAALVYWMIHKPEIALANLEQVQSTGFGHRGLDAIVHAMVSFLLVHEPDAERLAQSLYAGGHGAVLTLLHEGDGSLADAARWRVVYAALAEYLNAERALADAKGKITTAAEMAAFNELKRRRDVAKGALL